MASKFKKVIPLLNRVLVKRLNAPKTTASGIILPEKRDYDLATVMEVGAGVCEEGKFRECYVKKGQVVMLPSYGGTEFEFNGEKVNIYKDSEFLAVFQE